MKELYLIRHAKSSWDNPQLDDFDRPLNARGRRNAPFMGQLLYSQGIIFDLMIASPAVRTALTAEIIATETGYPLEKIAYEKRIYEGSLFTLMQIIHGIPDDYQRVAIIGHNDELTLVANALCLQPITDNIPTCGVAGLEFSVSSWKEIQNHSGKCRCFEYPKKYESPY
jgi:phosphohistidine phosphatase